MFCQFSQRKRTVTLKNTKENTKVIIFNQATEIHWQRSRKSFRMGTQTLAKNVMLVEAKMSPNEFKAL